MIMEMKTRNYSGTEITFQECDFAALLKAETSLQDVLRIMDKREIEFVDNSEQFGEEGSYADWSTIEIHKCILLLRALRSGRLHGVYDYKNNNWQERKWKEVFLLENEYSPHDDEEDGIDL